MTVLFVSVFDKDSDPVLCDCGERATDLVHEDEFFMYGYDKPVGDEIARPVCEVHLAANADAERLV